MGIFTRKPLHTDEYQDLLAKHLKLNNDVLILSATVERMETRLKSFHTKLSSKHRQEDEDEESAVSGTMSPAELQQAIMGLGRRPD